MADLAVRPQSLLNPVTGEVLSLAAPDDKLAQSLWEIRDLESRLVELKAEITKELLTRMDSNAVWTQRAGDYQMQGASPELKVEYDGNELRSVLDELVAEKAITETAAQNCVEQVVTFKPVKRGINALKKLSPSIAERIDACAHTVEKRRYVSIKRKGA